MEKWCKFRWLVVCDDEMYSHRTRAGARKDAAWTNRHPSNVDRRRFGPYRFGSYLNADGCARIVDLGDPDQQRRKDGKAPYGYDEEVQS
jgi:hypothetical protein